MPWQIFRAVAIMATDNSYFDILPVSKLLITSKLFKLEVFMKYVVQLDALCHGKFSEL